jgi:3-dehydroquinate dehydratase II
MKILVINGPNLNMLGQREKAQYGSLTLPELEGKIRETYADVAFTFFQSNHEGEIVERLHDVVKKGGFEAIIANFGAYTHTSVAIRDALAMVTVPKVEVHLSNIHAREEFRHTSLTGGVCNGIVAGFGVDSYLLGVQAALNLIHS